MTKRNRKQIDDVTNDAARRDEMYRIDPFGTAIPEIVECLRKAWANEGSIGAGIEYNTLKAIHDMIRDLDPAVFCEGHDDGMFP